MRVLQKFLRLARISPFQTLRQIRARAIQAAFLRNLVQDDDVIRRGKDRTAYVIGLCGSGRLYIVDLIRRNLGERAKYLRELIRCPPGPTSMIYSAHATIKHVSRGQAQPDVTRRMLEAVKSGLADLIFVYRHPLNSLLSNWVMWRTYIRDNRIISATSEVYRTRDEFCADLDTNFSEFEAFAAGDPDFFAVLFGPPFLSFAEFVEETVLYIRSATLPLRFEDFMVDPLKEFSKIANLLSVDLDTGRLRIERPRAKPYGYLAVKDKVPRFGNFIRDIDAETKARIETIGYDLGV